MKTIKALLAAAGTLLAACSSLSAATLYTEAFSADAALWTQNNNTAATWVSTGGVGGVGDGYITTSYTVPITKTGTPVVARATGTNGASGNNFFGSYTSAGITSISFSIKTDATFALPVGLRLSGNSPGWGMTISSGGLLSPTTGWTTYSFDLTATNPNIVSFEGTAGADNTAKFNNIMANVTNLQVFLNLPDAGYTAPGSPTAVTFSIDNVQAVPEPSTYLLMALGLGGLFFLRRKFQKA